MHDHDFLFLGGLHRSGTTVLHDSIAAHPSIAGLENTGVPMNEGQFLQDVYAPAGRFRKLWPIHHLSALRLTGLAGLGYGGPGRFGFDAGSHLTEEALARVPDAGRRLFESWAPYWDLGRRVLAEKSPPNLIRTRFLQAALPRTSFLIITRHPIAVSYATRKWTPYRPLHLLFEHWLRCNDVFKQDQPHLERVMCLRYEDFIAAPAPTLDRVFAFLGLEPIPLRLEVKPTINDRYFDRWRTSTRGGPLRRAYARYLRRRFGSSFERYGYSLDV
jgi:hypothetical protein